MPKVVRELPRSLSDSTAEFTDVKVTTMPNRDFMVVIGISVVGLLLGLTFAFFVSLPEELAILL